MHRDSVIGRSLAAADRRQLARLPRELPPYNLRDLLELSGSKSRSPYFTLATSTQRTYELAWRRFAHFCFALRLAPLPAAPATVRLFVDELLRDRNAQHLVLPGTPRWRDTRLPTIARTVSMIGKIHRWAGAPDPTEGWDLCRKVHSSGGTIRAQLQAIGANARDLAPLLESYGPSLIEVRAATLLAAACTLPMSLRQLLALDLKDLSSRDGVTTLRVPQRQPEQQAEVPVQSLTAQWFDRWLSASAIRVGPVFCRVDARGNLQRKPIYINHALLILKDATRRHAACASFSHASTGLHPDSGD